MARFSASAEVVFFGFYTESMNPQSSTPTPTEAPDPPSQLGEPQPSYVKLAMRNMVRKKGKSLFHFTLTTVALLGLLIGVSYLTR
jgi:hypothetical protein